jgi:hypothetical protein
MKFQLFPSFLKRRRSDYSRYHLHTRDLHLVDFWRNLNSNGETRLELGIVTEVEVQFARGYGSGGLGVSGGI